LHIHVHVPYEDRDLGHVNFPYQNIGTRATSMFNVYSKNIHVRTGNRPGGSGGSIRTGKIMEKMVCE
jgi:hypothetical protein